MAHYAKDCWDAECKTSYVSLHTVTYMYIKCPSSDCALVGYGQVIKKCLSFQNTNFCTNPPNLED